MSLEKCLIGWEEWCSLPALGLPAIKAKTDTGARTSALHAFDIQPYQHHGEGYIRFAVHPLQHNNEITVNCHAKLIDQRKVMNSGGQQEMRYVIATTFVLDHIEKMIELTLTDRTPLSFRMLLGRSTLCPEMIIDPNKSFIHGKIKKKKLQRIYS